MLYGLFFFGNFTFEVMVGHCANAGVGPNVFCGFNHIDDGVNRQDDSHHCHGSPHAGHKREGQEIATHRHSGIPYGRDHGDQHPHRHRREVDCHSSVLQHKQGGHRDKGGAAVHVDGGAERKDKPRDPAVHSETQLGALHRDGERGGGTLREESHKHRRIHRLEDFERIQSASHQEKRENDYHLGHVAADHHEHIFADRVEHHASRRLGGKLFGEGHDAERESPDQTADQDEKHFLRAVKPLFQHRFAVGFRHTRNGEAHGKGYQKNRKHIPFEQRLEDIVWNNREEMLSQREVAQIFRHGSRVGGKKARREIPRTAQRIERHPHSGGRQSGQQSVLQRLPEDPCRRLVAAKGGESRYDSQGDRRHGQQLEEPGIDGGDHVGRIVDCPDFEQSEHDTGHERAEPDDHLPAVETRTRRLPRVGLRNIRVNLLLHSESKKIKRTFPQR